ncbi:MAG: orotidine-5'-phosphate decarboxylase [Bdellovibrionota bacterium]
MSSFGALAGPLAGPLIVALDVDSADECLRLAHLLKGRAHAFKMGPRLCMRYGADLVKQVAALAPVFIDNKYLDIPSTMEAAIRATHEAGATLATVHAWAGPEALRKLSKVEAELASNRPFKILVVTLLTSFSKETLPATVTVKSLEDGVSTLADAALASGLTGIVCSPNEVSNLRAKSKEAFLVTPGVRLDRIVGDDQKRVETPASALSSGASALVVGRPIIEAKDPVEAADRVLASIKEAKR